MLKTTAWTADIVMAARQTDSQCVLPRTQLGWTSWQTSTMMLFRTILLLHQSFKARDVGFSIMKTSPRLCDKRVTVFRWARSSSVLNRWKICFVMEGKTKITCVTTSQDSPSCIISGRRRLDEINTDRGAQMERDTTDQAPGFPACLC